MMQKENNLQDHSFMVKFSKGEFMKKEDYEYMWKKLKKSLEEIIESDYSENKEIFKIMLQFMKAEEDEIGE